LASDPIAFADAPPSRRRRKSRASSAGKLRLRRNVLLRDALIAAFTGAIRAAERCAAAAPADPERAVHDFRKSIRRARSVVSLLRPALGRQAADGLDDELRRAFHDSSDLRDGDVLSSTLAELAGDDAELFVEAAEITARLGSPAPPEQAARIIKAARPILRRLPAALEVTLPRAYSTPDLEKGLERGYRRAQQALREAAESGTEEDFHTWRKRVKELRYQVELLASTGSPPLKAREKPLGALARELGEVTDLSVLCGQIEKLQPPAVPGEAPGSRLLERGRAATRERSAALRSRGQELFADEPRAFALRVLAERG
jgi:CHAD domain-containing protein